MKKFLFFVSKRARRKEFPGLSLDPKVMVNLKPDSNEFKSEQNRGNLKMKKQNVYNFNLPSLISKNFEELFGYK